MRFMSSISNRERSAGIVVGCQSLGPETELVVGGVSVHSYRYVQRYIVVLFSCSKSCCYYCRRLCCPDDTADPRGRSGSGSPPRPLSTSGPTYYCCRETTAVQDGNLMYCAAAETRLSLPVAGRRACTAPDPPRRRGPPEEGYLL